MEKFLMIIGASLMSLGIGFLVSYSMIPDLHGAFVTGGYLWTALGAVVMALGYKTKRSKDKVTKSLV